MSQYVRFERDDRAEAGRKTQVWLVIATRDSTLLGTIKWFGRWRQYAFFPEAQTAFNPECLDSITDWTRSLMRARNPRRFHEAPVPSD